MKIAIHHRERSFSTEWIKYCETNNIDFKIINCYSNSIISDVEDCDIVMWHWHHMNPKDILFARQLIFALEKSGKLVFPNLNTCMYFDDKLGQKYLFEAMKMPLVPSYAFYEKQDALKWAKNTSYPVVFKLRGGSGALTVRLLKTPSSARKVIRKAFTSGHSQQNFWLHVKDRLWIFRRDRTLNAFIGVFKPFGRLLLPTDFYKFAPRQKNYVYFQKFLPNNNYDIRVIAIGDRCVAKKRFNREGDFRASGSGLIEYDPQSMDTRCIETAFHVTKSLGIQSLAFDFIYDEEKNPLIVEISYAFPGNAYEDCPGFWDSTLNWHQTKVIPQYFMIEDLISVYRNKS